MHARARLLEYGYVTHIAWTFPSSMHGGSSLSQTFSIPTQLSTLDQEHDPQLCPSMKLCHLGNHDGAFFTHFSNIVLLSTPMVYIVSLKVHMFLLIKASIKCVPRQSSNSLYTPADRPHYTTHAPLPTQLFACLPITLLKSPSFLTKNHASHH